MIRFYTFFLVFILPVSFSFGQSNETGSPFVQNYSPKIFRGSAQNWSIAQDDRQLMYFANGEEGVMEYDGSEWRHIPVTNLSAVRTLTFHNGLIYAGAIGEIGVLKPDKPGSLKFVSLLDKLDKRDRKFADVWTSHSTGKGVIFYTDSIIIRINGDSVKTWYPKTKGFFLSFEVNNTTYIHELTIGLQKINNKDDIVLVANGDKLKNERIYTILPYKDNSLLIGSSNGGLLKFDPDCNNNTKCIVNINTRTSDYLISNSLYNGVELPGKQFAFGTLFSGLVITNYNGVIVRKINKSTNLSDDVIYFIFVDHQNSLWLSLSNGLAKVEPFNAISIYPETSGLNGSIVTTLRFNNSIYAGTFNGIYKLENNRFIKVDGILQQSWDLLAFEKPDNEKLLLAGVTTGLYFIKDKKSTLIEKISVCFKIKQSKIHKKRIYIGFQNGVRILEFENNQFKALGNIQNLNTAVRSIVEMPNGDLWLGTTIDGLFHIKFTDKKNPLIAKIRNYKEQHGLEALNDIRIFEYKNKLFFATGAGNYIFDSTQNSFIRKNIFNNASVDILDRIDIFSIDSKNDLWFSTGSHKPDPLGFLQPGGTKNTTLFTRPFKRIPAMEVYTLYNDNDITWIGGTEGLYRYDKNAGDTSGPEFFSLIRKVLLKQDSIIFNGTYYDSINNNIEIKNTQTANFIPRIPYMENDISIFFSATNYIAEEETQFKFYLKGYDKNWSDWTLRKSKEYTNIPEGDYVFHVKAKNIYDEESSIATYKFKILPPWYRTIAAYIAYAILVYFIIRVIVLFYTKRLKQANIRLEELVKTRTVEIEQQNKEIQSQAKQLTITNKELEKLSIVASKTNNGVVIMDADFNIEWVNEGFTKMLEYNLEQLKTQKGENIIDVSSYKKIREKLDYIKSNKKTVIYEAENTTRGGKKLWIQTTITPIINANGRIIKLIAIDSDITQLKKAEKEIINQRDENFRQRMEITDSIIYSRHIQHAILPSKEIIESLIPGSFIFNQPKEIIGGDFYWLSKNNNFIVVAVADCTGHGVPGALMSMLGITFLNEIVNNKGITSPAEILNRLRNRIIQMLHQNDEVESSMDGMDMAVCAFNLTTKKMKFAGANNPVLVSKNNTFEELLPDKMPIRQHYNDETSFSEQEINFTEKDTFYMFSDGFADQFGGPEDKKYLNNNFKKYLNKLSELNMEDRLASIEQEFNDWKGSLEQVDDVMVLGFNIGSD